MGNHVVYKVWYNTCMDYHSLFGNEREGLNWSPTEGRDRTREIARRRDNHQCQSCFKKWRSGMRRFDVHHLNGLCGKRSLSYDKVADVDGLITLCHKCHFNHPEHSQAEKFNQWDKESLRRMRAEGMALEAIGGLYGVTRERIRQLLL